MVNLNYVASSNPDGLHETLFNDTTKKKRNRKRKWSSRFISKCDHHPIPLTPAWFSGTKSYALKSPWHFQSTTERSFSSTIFFLDTRVICWLLNYLRWLIYAFFFLRLPPLHQECPPCSPWPTGQNSTCLPQTAQDGSAVCSDGPFFFTPGASSVPTHLVLLPTSLASA